MFRRTYMWATFAVIAVLAVSGCAQLKQKLFTVPTNKLGEYSFDRNARAILLGRIDELRTELFEMSIEQNYEGEFKAYRRAKQIVLKAADRDNDKHITSDEIFRINMKKVRNTAKVQQTEDVNSPDNLVGDFTVDKNAHHLLMNHIDALRKMLFEAQGENYTQEYESFRQAQDMVLKEADSNNDKHITPEEIYAIDMDRVREQVRAVSPPPSE